MLKALFAPKREVGTMRLDFLSHTEVVVTGGMPDATRQVPYCLRFAFMYAGKLLWNLGADAGGAVAMVGAARLHDKLSPDQRGHGLYLGSGGEPMGGWGFTRPPSELYNASMLGLLSGQPLTIVPGPGPGRWVYAGTLYYKGDILLIDTRIAWGEEEYLHCAAVDTVLEVTRRRLGDRGGVVCTYAYGYLTRLFNDGCGDMRRNLTLAAEAATRAALDAGLLE